MAGALGLRLGGPRAYQGEIADLPFMGEGRVEAEPEDIERALRVYRRANDLSLVVLVVLMFVGVRIGLY